MNKIINGVASEYDIPMKYENKKTTIFIDTQDMEERYAEGLYMDYLKEENQQLKDRINKAIDYIEECESFMFGIRENDEFVWKDTETKKDLLEILKGNNNEL